MKRILSLVIATTLIFSFSFAFGTVSSKADSANAITCTPANGTTVNMLEGNIYEFSANYQIGVSAKEWRTRYSDKYEPKPVAFSWNAVTGATGYILSIGTKANLSDATTYTVLGTSTDVEDLYAGTDYYYQVSADGVDAKSSITKFTTANLPRTISIDGVTNTRDIGGCYTEDGKYRVKQGMLYRGANMNSITDAGIEKANTKLGIKTDLDLRETAVTPPLGPNSNYIQISGVQYENIGYDTSFATMKRELEVFTDKSNYPIYFHCNLGRDRTGTLALVLEGILGMSKVDIYREYELSYFSKLGNNGVSDVIAFNAANLDELIDLMEAYGGGDLQDGCKRYAKDALGMTDAQINTIRTIMLESTQPETTTTTTTKPAKPGKVTIKAKNIKKKSIKVTWKKVKVAKGYQVSWAKKKNFKGAKKKTTKKTSVKIAKLKKKKTYYVKVRAYNTGGKTTVYGSWSKTKKVKIKK